MKEKHYILDQIYTEDLEYWQKLIAKKDICDMDIIEHKIFINDVRIEEISNTEFIELTKEYCTVIDQRPEDPIEIRTRYDILIKSCLEPGYTFDRKTYDPLGYSITAIYPPKNENEEKISEEFNKMLAKIVMRGLEPIINSNMPKDMLNKLLRAHLAYMSVSPGHDEYLNKMSAFFTSYIAAIKYLCPDCDVTEINNIIENNIEDHKKELKYNIKQLKKLLRKPNSEYHTEIIKARIDRCKMQLDNIP